MASRKIESIVETLQSRGMNEGGIRDLLKKIKIAMKKRELDKLTNDPDFQRTLKKYNIKPVDWTKDYDY